MTHPSLLYLFLGADDNDDDGDSFHPDQEQDEEVPSVHEQRPTSSKARLVPSVAANKQPSVAATKQPSVASRQQPASYSLFDKPALRARK